jgi:hypothetical protein
VIGGTRNEVAIRAVEMQRTSVARWQTLGGTLRSPPTAGANLDGRVEVFARGLDDKIWRRAQRRIGQHHDFTPWEPLSGVQTFRGTPTVTLNMWNKLELFARGSDGALWHCWQNQPNVVNTNEWSPWAQRGGRLIGDPTVARNHDGRLEVMAIHEDGRVYRIFQRWFDLFGAPWSAWEPLGSRRFSGRVAVERDGSGRLWALARSRDDASLWSCRQTTPSGPWTDWTPTNGAGDEPMLGRNADGRLEAFVRGTNGRIYHQWQPAPGQGFSNWELLHDRGAARPVLESRARPTAWNQSDGSLAVIGVESDREAFMTTRINTDPWWSDYALVGSEVSSEVAAAAGGGQSALFALGPDRDMRMIVRRP